ncbi:hypothetical protein fugu_010201 [Takifugu bimaculatus]|uniref:Rad21/Rec8-like protein N-terminal domain-containing protein n=1 Tax=Takifugu bimaculatus TaxID=433685 RepID=A0A4Z2CF32_9TELE|nr:hypothetical protein fugu_010201 [Takifugu bimaculatus]
MNYVLEQVPPPQPGLPRPRFSLYLSSQLQYGVVVVFHRQCGILLEELQSIVGQLAKQKTSKKIDMEDQGKNALDVPDALSLQQETEGAPNPLFGVMQDMGLDASAFVKFEGEELVDQHRDTIDFLLAQADQFPEGDLELQVDLEKERKELTGSRLELQDGGLLPPEETGPSAPPREQRTPVSGPTPPSPPSTAKRRKTPAPQGEEGEKARRQRQRQRQLIFFDPVTQVTQGDLQRQIREREPSSESADSERELVGAAAREEDRHELSSKEVPRHMAEPEVFDISEVDRRTVSSVFQRLLEYLSSSKLSAQQDAPYGDILISPGPAYDQEVHLI